MKKLFVLALFMVTVFACAQTQTIVGSTITVTWDAPALGTIPVAQISYEVVVQPYPSGTQTLVGTIATLEQVVTFSVEGQYKLGIRTKRTVPGTPVTVLYSDYSWSDLEGTPTPWYAAYYTLPPKVVRVRIK
jgi:hypothetical protein